MTDVQPPPGSGSPASASVGLPVISPQEVQEGKAFAVLSYALNFVGIPFWILPLVMRNNDFALYHAKQSMMIWLAGVMTGAATSVLAITVVLACVALPFALIVWVTLIVFNIIGLINAINGKAQPLPVIGRFAEQWFAGLRKIQS